MVCRSAKRSVIGLAIGAVGLVLLGSGCANYGTLDVRAQVPGNPTEGRAVTIARVSDKREIGWMKKWSLDTTGPSLGLFRKEDRGNTNIMVRAIAFKAAGFLTLHGVYLLPEGRTVEDLVGEIVTKSFREAGYRVVDPKSALQEKATPIEADIDYFWCGFRDEIWASALVFEARIRVSGDLPALKSVEPVRARLTLRTQGAGADRGWMNTLNKGIDAFVKELKQRLGGRLPSPVAEDSLAAPPKDKIPSGKEDPTERLKKLDQMKKDGVITEEEYQKKRQAIIDSI